MRFIFLGTGTSAGVPAIACECKVCTSSDPRDRRLRTAAAIVFRDDAGSERVVLIDAGPDLREQALRHGLKRCDAIFFTHNHVDHTFGLDEVRRFNAVQHTGIPIYAEPHTMEYLRRVYRHIFEQEKNINESFVATLWPHEISADDVERGRGIDVFGLRVTPIRLWHGRLPVLGYRFDWAGREPDASGSPGFLPLAYCTDVSKIPAESWERLEGVRTLVLDALRHRAHTTHMSVAEANDAAGRINAEHTFYVHMAHDLGHEQTERDLPPRIRLAYDGLVLE